MQNKYDYIIIGSGIVGSLIARELSRFECSVLVVEKEIDVGMCPSSANSAIIHAGFDPKPGTMKARMNAEGNRLWHTIAPELGIQFKETGSYVVAVGPEELPVITLLYEQGVKNSIPGVTVISRDDILMREPLINPAVSGALWAPSAAVIDPFGAVLAAAENAVVNGVKYIFEAEFLEFIFEDKKITGLKTSKGDFYSEWVINSAGLFSDEVAHKAGVKEGFQIVPRKGSYIIFDAAKFSINNVLFQVPTALGKGVLVSTTTHGNVMIGPDSQPSENKDDSATTREGLLAIETGAKKLIPSIDVRNSIVTYSGIRATGNGDKDFIIEIPKEVKGLVNLLGIDSPGFVSAPAIAKYVIELLKESGVKFIDKETFTPVRKPFPHFHLMSHREKAELVKKNPAYGRIVCRCEEVTEGEILDAIHSPIPARTYDSIKRRTWLGTGRCQGAFDYPRVIQILAKELGIAETEVTKKGKGSELVFRRTKVL